MAKAKFDVKTEATKAFYAYAGANDLAAELIRDYIAGVQAQVTEIQKRVAAIDLKPSALKTQAEGVAEFIATDAKERRTQLEATLAELLAVPAKVSEQAESTYADLAKRGEDLVTRIRKQESTQEALKSAKTASAKAKTTRTQATKAANEEVVAVKKAAAKKTAAVKKAATKKTTSVNATAAKKEAAAAKSSAKATVTAATKAVEAAGEAVVEAAKKIGD